MQEMQIDAWIVQSSDPHQSEYAPECWKTMAWISGFTGSAGTLVVTSDHAGMWVDARYHIRAELELAGSGISPFKFGFPDVPPYEEWLKRELEPGSVVGFDGTVFSGTQVRRLQEALKDKQVTIAFDQDLTAMLWQDRPPIPGNEIFIHALEFAGETRASKLRRIRDRIAAAGADVHLVSSLDDIAWTLNIRGSDVAFHPVAISYLVILPDEVRLFIDSAKVPGAVRVELEEDGVAMAPYGEILSCLKALPLKTKVLIDPDKTSYTFERILTGACAVKTGLCIPCRLKAIKNETELKGIRRAHARDGAAIVKWMYWLEGQRGVNDHTEITFAHKLEEFRAAGENYRGSSFATIAGYGANSAVGHYQAQPETTPTIQWEGMLLVDSGGQYLDGTTDITRTMTLGKPSGEQKRAFTTALKALIRLSAARFPKGTTGSQLDMLARQVFWQEGWNCRHGIGHGVGHFLDVHEGPQRINESNTIEFEPGCVNSNEPGVYFEGRFGVRIENIIVTTKDERTEFGEFFKFETVTVCPIDLELVEAGMLSDAEREWLDAYHTRVYQTLAPLLEEQEREWLSRETRQIQKQQ